jgi:hypothetical protein
MKEFAVAQANILHSWGLGYLARSSGHNIGGQGRSASVAGYGFMTSAAVMFP